MSLEGHSLRPFMENPGRKDWNGPSVAFMGIRDGKEPPHFSVRSRQYRYTLCDNGQEELYDHKNDPHEWANLAGNTEYEDVKKKLRKELTSILK
jgi:hypothetical protein